MNLNNYKQSHTFHLLPRTVSFLVKGHEVLLGLKKTGFGEGNYIGIGGKVEVNETLEHAAKREVLEEINVKVIKQNSFGVINFYFPNVSWNQEVHTFIVTEWKGVPIESEEIKPKWFAHDKLPFNQMWDDARYWIPRILKGEKIEADFLFNEDLFVIDSSFKLNLLL